jgi:hypothetical protein
MALLFSFAASAGQRPFIYAYDTNIVSTGNIELEQWMWIEGPPRGQNNPAGYWVWWGPVVGATQHLEVAVPLQVNSANGTTWLSSFDADLRFRLFPQDDRDGFQALLRAAWHQQIANNEHYNGQSGSSRLDFNVSASYGSASELHAVFELGAQIPVTNLQPNNEYTWTYDVGIAYPVVPSLPALQVAAELYGQVFFDSSPPQTGGTQPTLWLGPSVSWSGTRYWATLGVLTHLTPTSQTSDYLLRLVWAVAL